MTLWKDLQYAARQLRKSPAFTFTVLATLGLCIGANTAIYTVVDALFFRPLPYPDPSRLVMMASVFHKGGVSYLDTSQTGLQWELIRDHASFLDSAVYVSTSGVNLYSGGRTAYIQQQRVSANFFHVLGIHPLRGREFLRQEDVPGGPPRTILSYELWQRLFRGDPSLVGRAVDLRGEPYLVVGIMPPGFRTSEPADLWTPLQPSRFGEGGGNNYGVIGRVKPGVTFAAVDGQLNSIMQSAIEANPLPTGTTMEEKAVSLQAGLTDSVRSNVNLMWGAVGLVLLIGCVNIAGILLARSAARSREIATRMAIGASRSRVVMQLLSEAALLAAAGGITGLLIGYFALRALTQLNPAVFGMWGPAHLDLRITAVVMAASLASSILFGLFPAFQATAVDLRSALSEGARGSVGSRMWQRQALVFAEIALGVVLVAGAALLIRTLTTLLNQNPGFNPSHVLTASLSLQDAHYKSTAAGARLFRESLERIRQIPGVESAGVALSLPYQRPLNMGIQRVSGQPVTLNPSITEFTYATPGMFEALQISLLRGRLFKDADNATAPKVMVVNLAFLKRYLPRHLEPLGADVKIGNVDYRIIGVVNDVQQKNSFGSEAYGPVAPLPQVYVPADQVSDALFVLANGWFSPSWVVRTRGDVPDLQKAMLHAVQAVDPRLPFSAFHDMSEWRSASLEKQRYQAALFSALATLALLLAALGVYGLIAQSVAQRTREMGIRLALGASVASVIRSATAPGITLSLAAVPSGLVLTIFATRLLKHLIWGISATDPATFAAVGVLLIFTATLSSVIPALRLARLDPAQTLRNE